MSGNLFILNQQRLIDRLGVASGGSIAFYQTGTSTKAPIYVDQALTIPMANPVVVDIAATVPAIWLDPSVTYRRLIRYNDGTTDDLDPYSDEYVELYQELTGPNGASLIGFSQNGAGAVQNNILARLRYTTHAEDFGILPDGGVLDQTSKVQNLLNAVAAGSVAPRVLWPIGTVRINSDVTFTGHALELEGIYNASTILCSNNAQITINGGLLDEHTGPGHKVTNIVFSVRGGLHTSGPLYINYGSNAIGSTWQPLLLENLVFQGETGTDGFTAALHIHNGPTPVLNNIRFFGDVTNAQTTGVVSAQGLLMTADLGNASSGKLTNIQCYWMDEGVYIQGHFEGVVCTDWIMVVVRRGLTVVSDSNTINLLIQMKACFINASVYCCYFKNTSEVKIDKLCVFFGEKMMADPVPAAWAGVIFELNNPAGGALNAILDIDGEYGGSSSPSLVRTGVAVKGYTGCRTLGLIKGTYIACNYGITLDTYSRGAVVSGAVFFACTNNTVNSGTNNSVTGNFDLTGT